MTCVYHAVDTIRLESGRDILVKRRDLIKKIAMEVERQGVIWTAGEGGSHSTYMLDERKVPTPRHREIGEGLAMKIFPACETELGTGWWKR